MQYVITTDGRVIIGIRNGNGKTPSKTPTPHPTLVGGLNPKVKMAGIVDIRRGKIYSYDNQSGHYRPNSKSMKWADEDLKNIQNTKILKEELFMNKKYPKNINKELFSVDFQSDFSEDEVDRLSKIAEQLINEFGEQVVFDEWLQYFKEFINGRYASWNFMLSVFNFGGHNFKVKDPYPFLGLLFNRLGLSLVAEPSKGEEETIFDTFDSIYVSLLTKSGIIKMDDYFYVNLFSDGKFKKTVEDNK